MKTPALISASEVAQFTYCRRAWWLSRVCDLEPANHERLEYGTATHVRHGKSVTASLLLRRAGLLCVGAGVLGILLFALIRSIAGGG